MQDIEEEQENKETHPKTIDHGELYENLAVQLGSTNHHTDVFNERVEAYEQAME